MKMSSINQEKYGNVFDKKGSIAVNTDADFNLIETIVRGSIY
jgi:N-acetylglucosamine-6-phosphate deacetylase